jgi:hypothetical protein
MNGRAENGFEGLRDELARAGAERSTAEEALTRARNEQRRLERDRAGSERTAERPAGRQPRRDETTAADAAAEQAVQDAQSAAAAADERLRGAIDALGELSDPRRGLEQLRDDLPILLLPLRLETRFRVRSGEAGPMGELWVRVYPDSCLVDTFEPTLSESELDTAKTYWQAIWRAGGVEADERGAWRDLVASQGSGRAMWIIEHFVPVNRAEVPVKASPDDVVLVIPTETALAAAERTAISNYWEAVWKANGNAAGEQDARATLDTAVGAARAAQLIHDYRPFNLNDNPPAPLERSDVTASVAFVVFPSDPATRTASWTRAPRVDLLPERLVLVARSETDVIQEVGAPIATPLYVGPDPYAAPADQLQSDNGDVKMPEQLRWMVDFDEAVKRGLGFRVPLTPAQARRGFDHLYVLGVRLAADGQTRFEQLLHDHHYGRSGFALLPQGAPTNNTESDGAAFTRTEDADESFADRDQGVLYTDEADWRLRRDGQWLVDLVGLDPSALERVSHSNGTDQLEARAMNTALWPATLGYFMETMMAPLFGSDTITATKEFFQRFVSGRGAIPAIRIGAQPYGILPTTAFSRIAWLERRPEVRRRSGPDYLRRLRALLRAIEDDWDTLAQELAHVGGSGDPQQMLLDIVGLHPASVEFHSRYAQSLTQLFNHLNLLGAGGFLIDALHGDDSDQAAQALLRRLGWDGSGDPSILKEYFHGSQQALDGGVVDDRPLSETAPIRVWTTDGHNYLQWLIDTANASLDALRTESGFVDDKPPRTLLYLLLRHALLLGYHDAAYQLHRAAGFETTALAGMKQEPQFVHVAQAQESAAPSESRWQPLYKTEPRITGSQTQLVSQYIASVIAGADATGDLREQLAALELLKDVPSARLERLLAEHLDAASYRLDAWQLALVRYQLEAMRYPRGENGEQKAWRGLHIGAYGWLENVVPKARTLERVQLDDDLAKVFADSTAGPLVHDSSNGGYIHAPSLDHATTVSVLRSGYLANQNSAEGEVLAVDISSRRVRLALSLLDGIRSGQSLGALLGYRFERGLHDRHNLAEVDSYVFALRKQFPLRADHLGPTKTPADVPIEAIEARNVVDGLQLIEHVRSTGNANYPFGLSFPAADGNAAAAIDAEVAALVDVHDAVADLALAEGVHQAVRGNYDRVAGTLAAYTTGSFPPEPEVVRTPNPGTTLTHRLALHLEDGLAAPAANTTPRSTAEPAVNHWLGKVLPPLTDIACTVSWQDPVSATNETATVSIADLHLQPLDVLYLIQTDTDPAMTELDDRVLARVIATRDPRPDTTLTINYMSRSSGHIPVFEVVPLIRSLRSIVFRSRPLKAGDASRPTETKRQADDDVHVERSRIADVHGALGVMENDLDAYLTTLDPLVASQPARRDDVVAGIDTFIAAAAALLARAAGFGIPQTGFGFALAWKQARFAALLERVATLAARWRDKLDLFDQRLGDYDALSATTSDADRFAALRDVERTVSTTVAPLPATPAALRTTVVGKRTAFATRRTQLVNVQSTGSTNLSDLIDEIDALLPLTAFDTESFTLDQEKSDIVAFANDLASTIRSLRKVVEQRLTDGQQRLYDHDSAAAASARAAALEQGAQTLLGPDFRIVPEFGLDSSQATEWQNAVGASASLVDYLKDDEKVDFPVDDWLYGVARVREKARAWEQALLFCEAFGRQAPELTPIQIPFRTGDHWLALQFPDDTKLAGEHLLYTAHYARPFDPTRRQCGLLLDEWTEVIPAERQTTGVALHFDSPNAEPPQSFLLVTPAAWNGRWHWDDLVTALDDTLALARRRAVEPDRIAATAYARFLPATLIAATLRGISIATVLATNVGAVERAARELHA